MPLRERDKQPAVARRRRALAAITRAAHAARDSVRKPRYAARRNTMLALVPPKPKLFDSATSIFRSCA